MSRYPSNFPGILKRHAGCTERVLRRAADIPAGELDSSADPDVMRIRKMVKAVLAEAHLMKAFVRLESCGDRILHGYMRPEHDVWDMVGDFFARRFPGTVILLGNGTTGRAFLYDGGSVLHSETGSLAQALRESMDIAGHPQEQPDRNRDTSALWETYYRSQYCEERRNIDYYRRNMPKKYTRAAALGMETNTGGVTLDDFTGDADVEQPANGAVPGRPTVSRLR